MVVVDMMTKGRQEGSVLKPGTSRLGTYSYFLPSRPASGHGCLRSNLEPKVKPDVALE